ncbi:MAG: YlmC/YmxH family sporulation protein [Bacilli bacterium]|nr:YlmC/YmxH family sporulation protein [Bacilli bacterium]
MRISDLQTKRIISVVTGKNIGTIMDAEIREDGKIDSFIIEQSKGLFALNREGESKILWEDITKIGEDVILVKKE